MKKYISVGNEITINHDDFTQAKYACWKKFHELRKEGLKADGFTIKTLNILQNGGCEVTFQPIHIRKAIISLKFAIAIYLLAAAILLLIGAVKSSEQLLEISLLLFFAGFLILALIGAYRGDIKILVE